MIETIELTKAYRRVRAVDGLSFTARPGRVTGFLGLNGSGKTTTLRMLLGLTRPTSGVALLGGKPFAELRDPVREVGAVLEQGLSHPGQSGRAHLTSQAILTGVRRDRVDLLLDQVGLTAAAHQRSGDYSLGMRQRLAVATALLADRRDSGGGEPRRRGRRRTRLRRGHPAVRTHHRRPHPRTDLPRPGGRLMLTLLRSELHRMATIRSSWLSIALFGVMAAGFGLFEAYFWALFAGIGAFCISVLTVSQHYQHRTIVLLYLARPRRVVVLFSQVLTAAAVAWVLTALTGITVLVKHSTQAYQSTGLAYQNTLTVVPVLAVFGAALAVIVRRPAWIFTGAGLWFIVVEGLLGQLEWPLPISSFLDATKSEPDPFSLMIFACWTLTALAVAVPTLSRDLSPD
ncbi:ATP-binding cassette domain-containing protein [Actinoplanes sp. N902-109]|uniref:ATP-binding cassette domain-containing protein n=1 Tax=Actinoplanes sp. (strain N902-109) TaxID=649831 RepID=UPI0003293F12|nr:ATP-binding cassette domain-containing protein [Actinoplanes sp. N902-109]AGL20034.1 ABC transporter [Actinoplanes sp. N902-109]